MHTESFTFNHLTDTVISKATYKKATSKNMSRGARQMKDNSSRQSHLEMETHRLSGRF